MQYNHTGSETSGHSLAAVPFAPAVPEYLEKTYWWAYTHPNAVKIFERQWLVNLILWGNFKRLRDLALDDVGQTIDGQILQVACVYGDFSQQIVRRLSPKGHLNVIDVAPVQIANLHAKLPDRRQVSISQQDATALRFAEASQDVTILFFLLHEMPQEIRRKTLAEALRVTRPGGKIVLVDYHKPRLSSPFRYVMVPILTSLEPFAMDLWRQEISTWMPKGFQPQSYEKQTFFGDLYQKIVITR
ncbi:MAG: rhodoquinone biosynthesis methyltransferase RquA [Rhodoferax sp.]